MATYLEPFHGMGFCIWQIYFACATPITLCVLIGCVSVFFFPIMLSSALSFFVFVVVCVWGATLACECYSSPGTLLLSFGVTIVLGSYSYPTLVLECHSCLWMLAYLLGQSMTCMLV